MVSSGKWQKTHLAGADNPEKPCWRGGLCLAKELECSPGCPGESWWGCGHGSVRVSPGCGKIRPGIYEGQAGVRVQE